MPLHTSITPFHVVHIYDVTQRYWNTRVTKALNGCVVVWLLFVTLWRIFERLCHTGIYAFSVLSRW